MFVHCICKIKQLQGINAAPIRAGEPNKETAFALNYFNVTPQPLVKDFYVKVGEAVYTDVEGLPINASLKDAANGFPSMKATSLLSSTTPSSSVSSKRHSSPISSSRPSWAKN